MSFLQIFWGDGGTYLAPLQDSLEDLEFLAELVGVFFLLPQGFNFSFLSMEKLGLWKTSVKILDNYFLCNLLVPLAC